MDKFFTIKKIIVLMMCFILFSSNILIYVNAEESDSYNDNSDNGEKDEEIEISNESTANVLNGDIVNDLMRQKKFTARQGHGFAAEQANNFIDRIKGKNTIVVGDNNVKNGPDRYILERDGREIFIQDKFYSNARASVDACFDADGIFKYIDANGNFMQIEVPKDQYDAAVERMKTYIEAGKVPNVTDPSDAEKIIRRSCLNYDQVVNIAKAGTVESLVYDSATGVVTAAGTMGITTILNYAIRRMDGLDKNEAIKESAMDGVKTGTGVFCTAVIAGQLTKAGAYNVFMPASESLSKALGKDFSETLIKVYSERVFVTGGESVATNVTQQAAKILSSEVLVSVVASVVFTVPDAVNVFQGRISKKQFVKNFAVTATGIAAGAVGYGVGGALGNLIAPGAGTLPGGIAGSALLGLGGSIAADKIADHVVNDDAEEMYDYMQNTFQELCIDYMVNETEAENIVAKLEGQLTDEAYKDMYQSINRDQYARNMLEPLFEEEVSKREKVECPIEEEYRWALKEELEGVVFVH